METYRIIHSEEAKKDRKQILIWYHNINPQLAVRFNDEVEQVKQLISNHPKIAPVVNNSNNDNIRQRAISKTFPYNIIYQINETEETITILAIRHQKRYPIFGE